ncbi:hypothetical protein K438DRAFT_1897776 [Mycena galopus ATCC 62051]|nr:hypothetical protein K438DRAFT_1897776 [Mycena galopus ATCC 62051]
MGKAAVFQRDTAGFALGITREGTTQAESGPRPPSETMLGCSGDGTKLAAGANGEKRRRAS